jgi:hypothetical protein
MAKVNRAAQFAPFDALKGLQEALREKEEKAQRIQKKEISEERQDQISEKIVQLERGTMVELVYFSSGKYITIKNGVENINLINKNITIEKKKIFFSDISII